MQTAAHDQIVLVAGPGPEVLAAVLLLAVAAVGAPVAVVMARRGRIEAWSLVGLFGLLMLAAVLVLAYVPTRFVLDRSGAEIAFWSLRDQRGWDRVAAAQLHRGRLGTWVTIRLPPGAATDALLWTRWPGLFVPNAADDPRQTAMRIEAWRLSAGQ